MILERDTFNIRESRIKLLMYDLFICGYAGSLLLCGLFSSCGAWASHAVPSLVAEQGSRVDGLSSCGTWA